MSEHEKSVRYVIMFRYICRIVCHCCLRVKSWLNLKRINFSYSLEIPEGTIWRPYHTVNKTEPMIHICKYNWLIYISIIYLWKAIVKMPFLNIKKIPFKYTNLMLILLRGISISWFRWFVIPLWTTFNCPRKL